MADQSEMYAAEEQYDKKYIEKRKMETGGLVKAYSLNEHICSRQCTLQKAVCLSQ